VRWVLVGYLMVVTDGMDIWVNMGCLMIVVGIGGLVGVELQWVLGERMENTLIPI